MGIALPQGGFALGAWGGSEERRGRECGWIGRGTGKFAVVGDVTSQLGLGFYGVIQVARQKGANKRFDEKAIRGATLRVLHRVSRWMWHAPRVFCAENDPTSSVLLRWVARSASRSYAASRARPVSGFREHQNREIWHGFANSKRFFLVRMPWTILSHLRSVASVSRVGAFRRLPSWCVASGLGHEGLKSSRVCARRGLRDGCVRARMNFRAGVTFRESLQNLHVHPSAPGNYEIITKK